MPFTAPWTCAVANTFRLSESMRAISPATPSEIQRPESVTATAEGPVPIGTSVVVFVAGSILIKTLEDSLTTQTAPCPVAMALGVARRTIVSVRVAEAASMRETLPPTALTTHTEPKSTEIASGPSPTGIRAVTLLVLGSTRETTSSALSAIHTAPAPYATPARPMDGPMGCPKCSVRGSNRHSALSPNAVATHTESAPTATATGGAAPGTP